jgi:hypothetical protein
MSDQKKAPGGGNREGANNYHLPNLTKPTSFPQHLLLKRAHLESIRRNDEDPCPVNAFIAQEIGKIWGRAYKVEVFNG